MLKNYIILAFRNLMKGKLYAFINISGLAIAFCVAILLTLTAYFQLTFDSFHKDRDRIFQTYFLENNGEGMNKSGTMPLPLGPALKSAYPDLEVVSRVQVGRKITLNYKDQYFEELLVYTDPGFFNLFTFPLIQGNKDMALNQMDQIVLSSALANTMFGSEDPMGKIIRVGQIGAQTSFIVSGIAKDAPINSTVKFDALARIESNPDNKHYAQDWHSNNHNTYVKLAPDSDPKEIENKLISFAKTYFPEENQTPVKNGGIDQFKLVKLQALKDVHFDIAITGGKGAPLPVIYAIIGLAIFILLIASINFINLNIARSFGRAKEIGIRKTLGSLKRQIIVQIWSESFFICLLGFALGLTLVSIIIPFFNARFDAKIGMENLLAPGFIGIMLLIFFTVTLFAGGFPAHKMAGFNLVETLKGKVSGNKKSVFRNVLLVTQFAISSSLICISVISKKQLDFLRKLPTGFDQEQVFSIPVGSQLNGNKLLALFRNRVAAYPEVVSVSGSGVNLGKGRDRRTARTVIEWDDNGRKISADRMTVDADFLKTVNIPLMAGKEFDRTALDNLNNKILISESMAAAIGTKNPIGSYFGRDSANAGYEIIGMFADFSLYSSTSETKPIIMHFAGSEPIHYIFIRLQGARMSTSIDKIKEVWKELAPGNEFLGSFLNENVNAWYTNESALTSVFGLASGIAIILSCLGLFAISLLVIELRMKEIGIRLIVGATMESIVLMLCRNFLKTISLALLISLPLAFLIMQKWLENYKDRIQPGIGIFISCAAAILLIALVTVGYQSIRAALTKPIRCIRTE